MAQTPSTVVGGGVSDRSRSVAWELGFDQLHSSASRGRKPVPLWWAPSAFLEGYGVTTGFLPGVQDTEGGYCSQSWLCFRRS